MMAAHVYMLGVTHEQSRAERQIRSLERELEHRAEVITKLVEELHATQRELADAVDVGSELAAALRAAVPDSPALLERL